MTRTTILVPNFNGGAMLGQCLRSVVAQTVDDWQVVVGDNASTDDSLAQVDRVGDSRIRVVARPRNVGWVTNVNLLIGEADPTPFVTVLHSDDWWEPGFLDEALSLLERNPSALLAATALFVERDDGTATVDGMFIDWPSDRGELCPSVDALHQLLAVNRLTAPCVVARRELYERLPLYDPTLPLCCDWLMWLRAAHVGDVAVGRTPLAHYRVHAASLTADGQRMDLWALDKIRMHRIVLHDWAVSGEPFAGAGLEWSRRITAVLASAARERSDAGDRHGAVAHARLARLVAPTRRDAALCRALQSTLSATTVGPGRLIRRPLVRAGQRLLSVRPSRRARSVESLPGVP